MRGGRAANDCRCDCGALLARVVAGGVELKCRHCKRIQRVPLEPSEEPETSRQRSLRDPAPPLEGRTRP
jgi:phage FluMu protein Com